MIFLGKFHIHKSNWSNSKTLVCRFSAEQKWRTKSYRDLQYFKGNLLHLTTWRTKLMNFGLIWPVQRWVALLCGNYLIPLCCKKKKITKLGLYYCSTLWNSFIRPINCIKKQKTSHTVSTLVFNINWEFMLLKNKTMINQPHKKCMYHLLLFKCSYNFFTIDLSFVLI